MPIKKGADEMNDEQFDYIKTMRKSNILSLTKKRVSTMQKSFDGNEQVLSAVDIVKIFKACDSWWIRDKSNPQNPHAELTSGKHSDGFVNCGEVMKHPNLAEIMGWQLALKISENPRALPDLNLDWVIGPAYGGIILAHEIAKIFGACAGFTEKTEGGTQEWKRFLIKETDFVWLVEDVITTGQTITSMFEMLCQGNPNPVNIMAIGVLVNRSDISKIEGREITALLEPKINTWEPNHCPLCKQGSSALRPKTHWPELTGKI